MQRMRIITGREADGGMPTRNTMKKMTLGKRIGLGFSLLLAISAALGLIAVLTMKSAQNSARVLATEYVPEADISGSLQKAFFDAQLAIRSYSLTADGRFLEQGRKGLAEAHRQVTAAQELAAQHATLVKLREHLASITQLLNAYEAATEQTVVKTNDILHDRETLNTAAGTFIASIDELIATQTSRFGEEITAAAAPEKLAERRDKLALLNKIRGEGNAARIAIFKAQALREPKIIAGGLKGFEVMDADFAKIVAMLKVQADIDELRRTQNSAHDYRDAMQQIMTSEVALEAIAKQRLEAADALSELTAETAATGMSRTVKAAGEASSALAGSSLIVVAGLVFAMLVGISVAIFIVRNTSRVLTHVAGALREASAHVASASSQVASSSQSLAEGASEQASSLEETSASLEEINSMAKRSTENAQNAKSIAENTRAAADHGTQQMEEMLTAMNAIKASSDNISKVIKTIDEIAFQTNILALNAAVEAARAGEAGMGFAVVAEEVRGLAQRAAQAAKETAGMIDESINRSGAGVGVSERVAATLKDIAVKARDMNALVAEIATASVEQSSGVEQVNSAVSQMDKVTQGNAANAEQSAAAAEELNAQATALTESVGELMALVGEVSPQAAAAELSFDDKDGRETVTVRGPAETKPAMRKPVLLRPARPVNAGPRELTGVN